MRITDGIIKGSKFHEKMGENGTQNNKPWIRAGFFFMLQGNVRSSGSKFV